MRGLTGGRDSRGRDGQKRGEGARWYSDRHLMVDRSSQ
jgi:hypothetical protein